MVLNEALQAGILVSDKLTNFSFPHTGLGHQVVNVFSHLGVIPTVNGDPEGLDVPKRWMTVI
jgi:hypothetical protein